MENQVRFHPHCACVGLTHLLVADDVMIFSDASIQSPQTLSLTLTVFEKAAGLACNSQKSQIFLAGCDETRKAKYMVF